MKTTKEYSPFSRPKSSRSLMAIAILALVFFSNCVARIPPKSTSKTTPAPITILTEPVAPPGASQTPFLTESISSSAPAQDTAVPPISQTEIAYTPLAAQSQGINAAINWLHTQQDAQTGGFTSETNSIEVLLTIGANQEKASDWRSSPDSPSLLDYWIAQGPAYSQKGAAEAGKLAAALLAAGGCWPQGAKSPWDYYDFESGIFDVQPGFQAWAMLGALAFEREIPLRAREYLQSQVQPNGAWEWNTGFGGDSNTTSLAIEALLAAGEPVTSDYITNGLNFLKTSQNSDGGFIYQPGSTTPAASDSNSTAYAIQAILAVGGDPANPAWTIENQNPIQFLQSLQQVDGSFEWQFGNGPNLPATAQAISALLGKYLPYQIGTIAGCP